MTITIKDLKGNMCRWPSGDPQHDDFHFCGARGEAGSPYCAEHTEMAHRSGTTAKNAATKNASENKKDKKAA